MLESKILEKKRLPVSSLTDLQGDFKTLGKKQFTKLKNSIQKNGFIQPFFIWKDKNKTYILDGHQRKKAIIDLYGDNIDVDCLEIRAKSILEAKKYCIYYASSYAEFDKESLIDFADGLAFDDLEDFEFPGLKLNENDFLGIEDNEADDELPEITQNELGITLGDVYTLGDHRLMCGDSTDLKVVDNLMNGFQCDITFTSPPYNLGDNAKLRGYNGDGEDTVYNEKSDHKSQSEYLDFLRKFTSNALHHSKIMFCNIQLLAGNKVAIPEYWHENRKNLVDVMIWDKVHAAPAMPSNVLNSVFEFIFILSNEKNAKRSIKTAHEFRGTIDNIFRLSPFGKKDELAKNHGAVFPVEFAQHFIKNFSKNSVLDLFGGSGTTMIACEKTKRKCYMMELDPHYCSIIVKRWEKYTGKKAVKNA